MTEVHPFIRSLYELSARDDRAALAELRRGFNNPIAPLPFVARFLRAEPSLWEERAFSLVASLFALHPVPGHQSLASALRHMDDDPNGSVALRFRALLDADGEDLGTHLRHAVTLVRGRELAIDWNDLFSAVRYWNDESKKRQRAWARDYWGARPESNEKAEATS